MTNTPTKFSKNPQAIDIIGKRSDAEQNIASTNVIQDESVLTRSDTLRSDGATPAASISEQDNKMNSKFWQGFAIGCLVSAALIWALFNLFPAPYPFVTDL